MQLTKTELTYSQLKYKIVRKKNNGRKTSIDIYHFCVWNQLKWAF